MSMRLIGPSALWSPRMTAPWPEDSASSAAKAPVGTMSRTTPATSDTTAPWDSRSGNASSGSRDAVGIMAGSNGDGGRGVDGET